MIRMLRLTAVAFALALSMIATATAAPEIVITSPAAGETISRSATPIMSVAGIAAFEEPQQETRTLYLRRSQCASGSDDARLSVIRGGSSEQFGCVYIAQPLNEVYILTGDEGLSYTYPSEDFSFTLDASKPITGTVKMYGGYGSATVDVRLTGTTADNQIVTFGTGTKTYTITGGTMDVPFSMQLAPGDDRKDFTGVSLWVRTRGVNALHGSIDHRNGASSLTIPVWSPSPTKKVQFVVDNPNFTGSAVRTATLAADGRTWTGTTTTPAVGNHTLYARAIQGSTVSTATPVPFAVTQ